MGTVTFWLLIAISDGSYNYGTSTVIDRFATNESCQEVRKQWAPLNNGTTLKTACLKATVAR